MKVCLNGKFLDESRANISALDNGFLYGDGVYETMRTYGGKILELDLHLKRLEKSAKFLGIRIPCALSILKTWAQKLSRVNRLADARMRITLSRGLNGFDFLTCRKPTLFISAEKLRLNPRDYTRGVSAVAMKLSRVLPEIKTLGLTHMMVAYRAAAARKTYEVILVDERGGVHEGASTNIFMVKGGVLRTPKTRLLPGLTRYRVIALARALGVKTIVKDFSLRALKRADEIFLTNRPREIIPVTVLEGKKVGDGAVGPLTRRITVAYRSFVSMSL